MSVEQWKRVDGPTLPPALLRAQFEDCEVQMRRVCQSIASGSDGADRIAALQHHALGQIRVIVIEVRVVIGKALARVELVYGEPTRDAVEELDYATVAGSDHLRASRSRNVQRSVRTASAL